MRYALLMTSVVAATSSVATADSFGGWSYRPPAGYTSTPHEDHVELTRTKKGGFCAISIFPVRELRSSAAIEMAYEWHNVVTHTFTAKPTKKTNLTAKDGTEVLATRARLTTGDATEYAGTHYVVMPPGMIGSVFAIAGSASELRACESAATSVVRSLDVDWSAPQLAADPEARVETPQGRWALSGPTNRQYTFAADGSYRFHSETRSGDRVTDETGTYSVRGNQLVLAPQSATLVTIRDGVSRRINGPLEKTSYTWSKRYVPETNEWRVNLTPRKATVRDGALPAGGYSYSDRDAPGWKLGPPTPGS